MTQRKARLVLFPAVSETPWELMPTRTLLLSNLVRNHIYLRGRGERGGEGVGSRRNDQNFLFKPQTCFSYQLWMKIEVGFCCIDWKRGWWVKQWKGREVFTEVLRYDWFVSLIFRRLKKIHTKDREGFSDLRHHQGHKCTTAFWTWKTNTLKGAFGLQHF